MESTFSTLLYPCSKNQPTNSKQDYLQNFFAAYTKLVYCTTDKPLIFFNKNKWNTKKTHLPTQIDGSTS